MIVLNNTGINNVYLTLSEGIDIINPDYYFKAKSKESGKIVEFNLTVLESNPRWDKCEIDGTLFKVGQYTYQVFLNDNVIENGLISVNNDKVRGWDSFVEYNSETERGQYVD